MHHEPLGAAGDAIESAPLPPPRKIVIVPPSELSLPCKDLGSNGLISLSIVKVGLGVPSDESATVVAPGPALGSGEPAASATAGTRLRRLSDSFPISPAKAMISLCLGVTSIVAV